MGPRCVAAELFAFGSQPWGGAFDRAGKKDFDGFSLS